MRTLQKLVRKHGQSRKSHHYPFITSPVSLRNICSSILAGHFRAAKPLLELESTLPFTNLITFQGFLKDTMLIDRVMLVILLYNLEVWLFCPEENRRVL